MLMAVAEDTSGGRSALFERDEYAFASEFGCPFQSPDLTSRKQIQTQHQVRESPTKYFATRPALPAQYRARFMHDCCVSAVTSESLRKASSV
jgi:hypothetical protein